MPANSVIETVDEPRLRDGVTYTVLGAGAKIRSVKDSYGGKLAVSLIIFSCYILKFFNHIVNQLS